ncbi:hypothetical protein QUB16_27575 [Microcoleus sp. D3_18a_C4]
MHHSQEQAFRPVPQENLLFVEQAGKPVPKRLIENGARYKYHPTSPTNPSSTGGLVRCGKF